MSNPACNRSEANSLSPSLLHHGIGAYAHEGRIGPAQWPHHDLIIVTRGRANFQTDQREFACDGGDALLVPPGYPFEGTAGKPGCVIWVQHFAGDQGLPGLPRCPEVWHGAATTDWPRTLMREIHTRKRQPPGESATLSHLLILLLMALQENAAFGKPATDPGLARVRAVTDWLEHHPHPLPDLEEVATRAGWSQSHLRAEFRRCHGFSLGQHTRALRLREAARLLCESNLPIKEIASRLGYGDIIAFHRAFTGFHGETPARHRARAPRVI
jgi:AraC-like DNA-binding protein